MCAMDFGATDGSLEKDSVQLEAHGWRACREGKEDLKKVPDGKGEA